jgi:hypothetical protein
VPNRGWRMALAGGFKVVGAVALGAVVILAIHPV